MWIWTLNWNEIREDLLIGSCPMTGSDLNRIRHETGASAILSLQHDECLAHFSIDYEQHCVHGRRLGLEMARSPMRDFNPGEQQQDHDTDHPLTPGDRRASKFLIGALGTHGGKRKNQPQIFSKTTN